MDPITAQEPKRIGSLRFLATRLLNGNLIWLGAASAVMVAAAFAANAPALLTGRIVDQLLSRSIGPFQGAIPFLAALMASFIIREVMTLARRYAVERVACGLERDEQRRLTEVLLKLDLSAFWGQRVGALNVRVNRSLEGLIRLVKLLFMDFMPTVFLALIAFILTATKSSLVLAVMAAIAAATLALTLLQVQTQKGIRMSLFQAKEEGAGNWCEVMLGLDYVRAAGGVPQETAKIAALSQRLFTQEFAHHKAMMQFDGAKQILEGFGYVAVVGLAAWQAANGLISAGDVLTLAMLYSTVAAPLRDLHRIIDEGFEGVMKVAQLTDIYTWKADRGLPGDRDVPAVAPGSPVLAAKDLTLRIQGEDGSAAELLRGLNLSIAPGEWIGVAGGSGCGKSSLMKIVLGLTPSYGGSLGVFGAEVRDVRKSDLWNQIAYVSQTPHILKGTVRDNLVYGTTAKACSDKALLEALERAGLSDRFAVEDVRCLDEPVEEQGRNLSGGERQRLAIARIFLRRPSLIVLDEATSALDLEREHQLLQNLRANFVGVTALVVAHRLEALKETSRIIVLRAGCVVEEGTFAELSTRDGEFRKIGNLRAPAAGALAA